MFVNTVPTAQTRNGDFSDFRGTNGVLIPIYDPLTTRANPNFNSSLPVSATNPQFLRDQFPNNIIPQNRIHARRPQRRQHLSAAERPGQLRQLHVDREPRRDRQRGLRPRSTTGSPTRTRSSSGSTGASSSSTHRRARRRAACRRRPRPRRASTSAPSSPASRTRGSRRTARPSTIRRSCRPTSSTSCAPATRTRSPFTFQSDFGINAADSLGIRGINVTEFTTGLPNINVADLTGISGGPAFLPVNPKQFHWQIEDALVWLKGRHQLKFGYRLVDRYPSPFTHTDTRGTITFGRNYTNNPVTNTGGLGHRGAADRLHQQRGARLPARAVHAAHAGARAVRSGRLQGELALHDQRRHPLRDLRRRNRGRQQDRQLRSGRTCA